MKQDSGNLWDYDAEYRVITTNGIIVGDRLVMGAGVALQASLMFPGLPRTLGSLVKLGGNVPFLLKQEGIITLPTKNNWRDPSDMRLIISGVIKLMNLVNEYDIKSVVMTRPGCGNGRLIWEDVKAGIEGILDDRFTVLTGE